MAYIRKRKGGWRAEVERNGVRYSATFPTKIQATNWAATREAELLASKHGQYPRKTLQDAMDRYSRDVSPSKAGKGAERNEGLRFEALARDFPELAGKLLHEIDTPDLVAWRDARLKVVKAGTVDRDINLLSNLFQVAHKEWKWCGPSPLSNLRRPPPTPPRSRALGWREIRRQLRQLGYRTGKAPTFKTQVVAHAWLAALRTGMRAGELLALTPTSVDLESRVARVPHKMQYLTGKLREVPFTKQAARVLRGLGGETLFPVSSSTLDALFRKAREQAGLDGFRFHDSRADALTRLAKKVDVLTLARISGHKDINLLLSTYYRESAESIAARI